jgi:hypothetical protein
MSIIARNCTLFFPKLDPKRPNNKYDKLNPTWEIQIRTEDRTQRKEWIDMGLRVKDVVPEEGNPYFRVNLRKKSIKADGTKSSPVDVVDGSLGPINPNSLGNGSVGNVRIFQYEYPKKEGGTGIANVLMGIQVTKHLVYVPRPRGDDFGVEETETIMPEETDEAEGVEPSFSKESTENSAANIRF